jgi:glutamyl-tRNA synthetase
MTVITRFAPSPTGYLHIGGARTALFCWLYARHHGGRFLLRIEDTDRARSTEAAVRAIFDGLKWLGLDWDDEPVFQFQRAAHHAELVHQLLGAGKAYRCFCTPEELAEMRERARAESRPMRYDGRWRDRDPAEAPTGIKPVLRLKAPREGETVLADLVQGEVRVANSELDDMVLLRADGTPTYMLSVVVDDHDMGITHVVRGDDHLTNAFRQLQLFQALGWKAPAYGHIPLIHGADGAKLSKRHGAVALGDYAGLGILPEAMRNYLLRLGWSHGDEEIIDTPQAIAWFGLDAVGRSPARFDMDKLRSLNAHYIRTLDQPRLAALYLPLIEARIGRPTTAEEQANIAILLPGLRPRAKTLIDLAEGASFLFAARPLPMSPDATKHLSVEARTLLGRLATRLGEAGDPWASEPLERLVRAFAEAEGVKLGQVAQPLRSALTGLSVSPPVFDVLAALGRKAALERLSDVVTS